MIALLTGAPGAGKGTQADLIAEKLGFRKISTGDALRRQIKEGTEIGKKAAGIMEAGRLVPDDVLFEILKEEVGQKTDEKILLDGYPRNVSQARDLEALREVHPVRAAVHLDVPQSELLSRLGGRRVCESCGRSFHLQAAPPKKDGVCDNCGGSLVTRPDDQMDKIKVRLEVYENETSPILDYYRSKGLYQKVDGTGEPDAVFESIKGLFSELS